MVSSARIVMVLLFLVCMLAPGSAFSVLSMDASPTENVQPKDPLQVSGTLQLLSSGSLTFPANHTLKFSTDLLKAKWNFTIGVDDISRQNIALRGNDAVLYGFSLSYPNDTPVQVEVSLEGIVPVTTSPALTAIRIQELDAQGLPVSGGTYSKTVQVITPLPTTPLVTTPPPTTVPTAEPTTLPLTPPSPTTVTTTEPAMTTLPPTTSPAPEPTTLPHPAETTPAPTGTLTPGPPAGGAFPALPLAILVLLGIALLAGGSVMQMRRGVERAEGQFPPRPASPRLRDSALEIALNGSWGSWWQHLPPEGSDIRGETLEAVFQIALELALEGREGRKVGTAFIVGDADAVLAHSRQLILNPFEGHRPEDRMITNPEMREAIKELAQLDGAFVIRGDGTIAAAARYITVDTSTVRLPPGLGTRHSSIAAITRMTRSIGIVVSQSGGKISILREGNILRTVRPFAQDPSHTDN